MKRNHASQPISRLNYEVPKITYSSDHTTGLEPKKTQSLYTRLQTHTSKYRDHQITTWVMRACLTERRLQQQNIREIVKMVWLIRSSAHPVGLMKHYAHLLGHLDFWVYASKAYFVLHDTRLTDCQVLSSCHYTSLLIGHVHETF